MNDKVEAEVWKYIPGTERMYQVSDSGRVRSYRSPGTSARLRTPRLLNGRVKAEGGSRSYVVRIRGKQVERLAEKLVDMAFGGGTVGTTDDANGSTSSGRRTRRETGEHSTNRNYKLVPIDRVPVSLRGRRELMPAATRVLDDFLSSKSKFSKIELDGWLFSSAQREIYRARKDNEERYGKVNIHTIAKGKDAGIYLSRSEE